MMLRGLIVYTLVPQMRRSIAAGSGPLKMDLEVSQTSRCFLSVDVM